MVDVTRQITWHPSFGLDRELDWLAHMDDWMISKKRYWGLALPIYECTACGNVDVIGSETELQDRAVEGWEAFAGHTPHRPWIDAVKIACSRCGETATRIKDVGNPWLDAGIVPFSTLRYRHNREYWEEWFPAEMISESFPGQFRNWFYSMIAQSTALVDSPPFLNVFSYALMRDEKGEEMHKSKGNAIWFDEAAEEIGVDAMRWLFSLAERTVLDRWIISQLQQLVAAVRSALDDYAPDRAARAIERFTIDELSNWYIRRNRRRFWKSENDADKSAAYQTLYEILTTLAQLLAPFTPFLAEAVYQNLVRSVDLQAPESVHLTDFPVSRSDRIDESLSRDMDAVLEVVGAGHAARQEAAIKVRQPLPAVLVHTREPEMLESVLKLRDQILDELNVKSLRPMDDPGQYVSYTIRPNLRALGPRLGKRVNAVRHALAALDAGEVAARAQAGRLSDQRQDRDQVRRRSRGRACDRGPSRIRHD